MENIRCTPTIALPLPGQASIADFLTTEIEEKEKKGVGMGSQHSPLFSGSWKGVPKGTSGMA